MEAAVNATDMLQMSPLHFAVERGFEEIIQLLIKYGAKMTEQSKFYQTPGDIAVENCRMDIYDMLQKSNKIKETPPEVSAEVEKLIKTCTATEDAGFKLSRVSDVMHSLTYHNFSSRKSHDLGLQSPGKLYTPK